MNQGKNICSQLKAIRRTIAEENNIELEIPECTFKGNCLGTCPQCESEVRYLESELAKRLSLGKAATVAGIALALATPAAAQEVGTQPSNNIQTRDLNQQHLNENDTMRIAGIIPDKKLEKHTLKGLLWDNRVNEPIPFANIEVRGPEGKIIKGVQSDLEGEFTLKDVPDDDNLTICCSNIGYQDTIISLQVFRENDWFQRIEMIYDPNNTLKPLGTTGIIIPIGMQDMQEFDKDGVHVRVK